MKDQPQCETKSDDDIKQIIFMSGRENIKANSPRLQTIYGNLEIFHETSHKAKIKRFHINIFNIYLQTRLFSKISNIKHKVLIVLNIIKSLDK